MNYSVFRSCSNASVERGVYLPPSKLLLFQNMVFANINKIRLQSGDPLDQACKQIGWWSEELVKEAQQRAEKGSEAWKSIKQQDFWPKSFKRIQKALNS